jgi:hypothetical protein
MIFAQIQPNAAAVAGGMICGMVIAVSIISLVGAVVLRASCWLFNKFAGGPGAPNSVPEPSLGKACVIALVTAIVQQVVGFVVGLIVGAGGVAAGANQQATTVAAMLVSIPIGFLVFAGLVSVLLPTTIGRAFGVALCEFLIGAVIAACIVVFMLVIFGVLGGVR